MVSIKLYAPVLITTLNRYKHFKECLESLEQCTGADKTDVYVALDYPPSEKYFDGWKKIDMIKNFGIPDKIKTDKRSSFSINNAKSSKSKLNVTQFKRICEDLEINLVCSSDPLFKPNAERENGTFKRRLKAELRHEGITDIAGANKYLNEIFIPKINKRFSYDINRNKNVMKNNNYSDKELNFIISIRNERTIDNASSIKYLTNYYLPVDESTGEIISFKSGTKCTVVNTYDNKLLGIINEKIYILQLVEKQNDSIRASKNGFKPSDDNPWRKFKIR